MFTHRNKKGTNERGALIMEAIAMLGLMTMMSPMIVRQTADHQTEKEEVSVAGQMKTLKSALAAYIAANYSDMLTLAGTGEAETETFSVNGTTKIIKGNSVVMFRFDHLAPYLPKGYIANGEIYGNKLFDSYKIGVRIECQEEDEGVCKRANMIGLVLSDHSSDDDDKWIDDRRAARIASMIGADGGYMRSSKTLAALGAMGEKTKVIGTQGVWEIDDVGDFFSGVNGSAKYDARIAAITTYAGSVSGDFLYRMKEESLPGANSMFTDLDMGSNSGAGCTGPADRCNKINNAGGMEVINGNIVILSGGRSKTNLDMNPSAASINVSSGIDFKADTSAVLTGGRSKLDLTSSQAVMQANTGKSKLSMSAQAVLNVGQTNMGMSSTVALINANANASRLRLFTTNAVLNAGTSMLDMNAIRSYFKASDGASRLDFHDTDASLSAGLTNLDMKATKILYLQANTDRSKLSMNSTVAVLNAGMSNMGVSSTVALMNANSNASKLFLNNANAVLNAGMSNMALISTAALINANANASRLRLSNTDATLNAGLSSIGLDLDQVKFLANNGASDFSLDRWSAGVFINQSYLGMEKKWGRIFVNNGASMLDLSDGTAKVAVGQSDLIMNTTEAQLRGNKASWLRLTNTGASLNASTTRLDMNATEAVLQANGGASKLVMNDTSAELRGGGSLKSRLALSSDVTGNVTKSYAGLESNVSSVLKGNVSGAFLNNTQIGLNVNNKGKFSLTRTSSVFDINGGTAATNGTLTFSPSAMTLLQNRAKIVFNSANSKIAAFSGKDDNRGSYLRLAKEGAATEANAPIAFYTDSGRIAGSFFQPEKVKKGDSLVDPVRKKAQLQINEETGQTKAYYWANADTMDASVSITTDTYWLNFKDGKKYNDTKDYYNRYDTDRMIYNRFRVDPAFVSVMNDIKQTSRGGARLSEALPNYILKGIYTLTNSYSAGPWPCSNTNDPADPGYKTCEFSMPYYTQEQLGVTGGGKEFNCVGWNKAAGSNSHPLYNSTDNACKTEGSEGRGYVTFKYYNSSYQSCPINRYCWAHPFMGAVPAPGYRISNPDGTEVLYGHEEGFCPDGYVPVLTVTPDSFEIGRILMYKPNADIISAAVKYNISSAGGVSFEDAGVREMAPMIQQGSWVGVYLEQVYNNVDNKLLGWYVAMGTATLSTGNRFKWNLGGIPANSWQLTAQTYCYFNPSRFTMPNMRFIKMSNGQRTNANAGDPDVYLTPMKDADDTKTTGSD